MAALRTLALLALIGVPGVQTSDCSYYGLLEYLNVTSANKVLEITRPVKSWTSTSTVSLDMILYGILDVDEKSQTVTSHIYTEMLWTNEFLTWNPSEFCGINIVTLPRTMIWIPDVTIQEDASDSGSVFNAPVVVLHPTGVVFTAARQRLTFTCQFDLSLFPFDLQHCNITFSSMSSDDRFMVLQTISNDAVISRISEKVMITQGEWKLTSLETITTRRLSRLNHSDSLLVYMVTFERKPMLYVINLIMPLFYLLILDLASFFISEAGGEKLSFKVTVLLSISVLLLILKDILPSTEEQMPKIANYCISVFTLVWLSVLETMLVGFLMDLDRSSGEEAEGSVEVDIQLEASCHKECPAVEEKGQPKAEGSFFPVDQQCDCRLLKQILDEVKAARQQTGSRGKPRKRQGFYRRLAKIIDYVFFSLYFITVFIFLVFLFIKWSEKES